jgi:branched-chain amino acid transport system substrate-binding protein
MNQGRKTWFFLTADYSFGYDLERFAAAEIDRNGGKVLGRARFPLGNADFSSLLLQAQSSGAQDIALGASGADTINAIKQAQEFGIFKKQQLIAPVFYISDIEGLGLEAGQGLSWITSFYWDRTEGSRAWMKRFLARRNQLPTRLHAGTYSAVLHYLKAIQAAGTDDGPTVAAKMRETAVKDPLFDEARIREDGRVMLDLYLMRVKSPGESKGPHDLAAIVGTIPAGQAYRPLSEGGCPYISASRREAPQ